jgi:phospholipid/cholesterol/gamma-HCH transport system permease protein
VNGDSALTSLSPRAASEQAGSPRPSRLRVRIAAVGATVLGLIAYAGGLTNLGLSTLAWIWRSAILRRVRFGRFALYTQMVRLGVSAIGVIMLVSSCIGLILAMQMAGPLEEFGQVDQVARIIAIAIVRELGPLISAIVLTGFSGAAVAAELGTMVVGEEIEALKAHALNPIRFLVMPRIVATTFCLLCLCVIGELVAIAAGWAVGVSVLHIASGVYIDLTIESLDLADFFTGLFKAAVFGGLIGVIACYNGLSVTGGASGVGRATTNTVVHSIVAIIFTDLIFTAVFYQLGWT